MNYKMFCLLLTLSAATSASAQKLYFRAGIGYDMPTPGQTRDQFGNVLNGTVNHTAGYNSYTVKNASYATGLHTILGVGYKINKNIAVELNGDFNTIRKEYKEIEYAVINSSGQSLNYTALRKADVTFLAIPSAVVQTANPVVNLYMRMGLVLPLATTITTHETYAYIGGDVNSYEYRMRNYLSVGFAGATGVSYKVSGHLSVWGEVNGMFLSLNRREREVISYTHNGTTYPASQLAGQKVFHYSNGSTNGSDQTFAQPYSNIGVHVGICYTGGKPGKPAAPRKQ